MSSGSAPGTISNAEGLFGWSHLFFRAAFRAAERTILVMNLRLTLGILFVAALLEAGGDALVRSGLHAQGIAGRSLFFALGAVVLFGYGYGVNTPPWDFGKLLGVYVVFFFVVAQLINWIFFHQRPTGPILIGGALILAGGAVISFTSFR